MKKVANKTINNSSMRWLSCFIMSITMVAFSGCEKEPKPEPQDDDEPRIETVKGLYSVSDSTQVQFASGNLLYRASTKTWSFAKHQYDCIGKDNENVDTAYDGWIDLFGWGTGNAPIEVDPNSTYPEFYDWGANIPGGWRTLSISEWNYVLFQRSGAGGKRGTGTVDGVHGLILLPDDWSQPEGCTFTPGYTSWDSNTYTVAEWKKMESASAVFLPAAGVRWNREVSEVGQYGYYWSSTPDYNSFKSYILFFNDSYFNAESSSLRWGGFSVRLVKNK